MAIKKSTTNKQINKTTNQIRKLTNEVSRLVAVPSKPKPKTKPKSRKKKAAKVEIESGNDFISTTKIFGPQDLENDLALVFRYEISPASFPGTRLELLSNAYQFYKFSKFKISYKPTIPTAINAQYIAYFDTDPDDEPNFTSVDQVMRVAKAHQASVQGMANKQWSVSLPIKDDKTDYFTVPTKDKRFTTQAVLYIIQIGQATNFEGKQIQESLVGGALSVEWTCKFSNPQLNPLNRIYDGVSQKTMLKVFKSLYSYRRHILPVTNANIVNGTPYRFARYSFSADMFNGRGSYLVQKIPLKIVIPNTVKSIRTYSPTDKEGRLNKFETVWGLGMTAQNVIDWVSKTWKTLEGGIHVALEVFDVIEMLLPLFNADQVTGVEVDADYNLSDSTSSYYPIGYSVIQYEGGSTMPVLEEVFEFKDSAHAADTVVQFDYESVLLLYKLQDSADPNQPLPDSNVPIRKPS